MGHISRLILLVLAFAPVAQAAGRPSGYRTARRQAQALLDGAPAGRLADGAHGRVADNGNIVIHSAPRGTEAAPERRPGQTMRLFGPDERGRIDSRANTFVTFKNGHELSTHLLATQPPQHSLWRQDAAGQHYKQRRDAAGKLLPRGK